LAFFEKKEKRQTGKSLSVWVAFFDMKKLFLLLNHTLSDAQRSDAVTSGFGDFQLTPDDIKATWSNIPPVGELPTHFLSKIIKWLEAEGSVGDYVLVQGDFGATYYIVSWCLNNGFIPIYATTNRIVSEQQLLDGSKKLVHTVKHVNFRKYASFV
jgi:hypothetical protein